MESNKSLYEAMIEEYLLSPMSIYTCTICGEEIKEVVFVILQHFADHISELMVKVDKVLEEKK